MFVEHDAKQWSSSREAAAVCEQRVVRRGRDGADEYRVVLVAQKVCVRARLLGAYRARVARARGDATVEQDGELEVYEGSARAQLLSARHLIRRGLDRGLLGQHALVPRACRHGPE